MGHALEKLPVIVARVADDAVIDYLTGVAMAGSAVYMPLVAEPSSSSPHVLEVYSPGRSIPLTLIAEPLGPRGAKGYPLRLSMPAVSAAPASRTAATPQSFDDGAPHAGIPAPVTSTSLRAVNPQTDPFVGRKLAGGKLTIELCVGTGGAGTVYRARHRDLEMSVAVKVMHEAYQRDLEFCKRFHAEALSASRLDHAHLTRVLDFGQEPDGLLYLAMEYLDGKSLRQVLEAEKRLPFDRVAQIMIQVCSGLTHAHARNVVHRDIKPENLMLVRGLDEDGRETDIVKVCDFGIAHRSASDSPAVFAGTAEYISPEQFRGEEPGVQSDVYACGVVLYELLTGVVPIAGDMPEIVDRAIRVVPEPPSHHVPTLDARIDRLVLKTLSKDREIRHASARELRAELKETAEEIALFSAGGYYDVATTMPPSASAAPVSAAADDADWLERGTGYLASMAPPPNTSSAPPQRAHSSVPHGSEGPASGPRSHQSPRLDTAPPSMRASQPSYPAMRASSPSYSELAPSSSSRSSHVELREAESPSGSGSILPGSHVSMTPTATSEADDVARAVASFLKRLLATTDPVKFAELAAPLEPKIRALVEQGHVASAWKLCSALDMIATEPAGATSRAEHARAAVEVFSDRALLAQLAESALDPLKDRSGLSRKLLSRAGDRGAHAVYGARTKHGVFEARERFVALLQEIGGAALPTLSKALELLESRLAVPGAMAIAEDLLKAVPDVRDDVLGQCLARYAKVQSPSLAMLATTALPKAWGSRSRSLLLSQLHHREDEVAIAAMKCLRKQLAIDTEVVGQLGPMVLGSTRARQSLRLAATEALLDATPEALPLAKQVLADTLAASQGITPDVEEMVVAVSSVLIAIKGDGTLVAERWKKSTGFLRTRLEALLRQARA